MSIFASRTRNTITIPFGDPQSDGSPHTVTIQKLAGRHMEQARQVAMWQTMQNLRQMGGAEVFNQELAALGPSAAAAAEKARADPLNGLDPYTVLARGIVAWTYAESLTPTDTTDEHGVRVQRIAAIDDLDEEASDYIACAIVALGHGPSAEARKNDSRPSTAA